MNAVREALYALLSADEELATLATGVHHRIAPEGTEPPYLVFNRQSGVSVWSMRDALANELWLVKGICRGGSSSAAEAIDARCEELLNDVTLTVEGKPSLYVRRESAVDYGQADSGEEIAHVGSVYRVWTEAP